MRPMLWTAMVTLVGTSVVAGGCATYSSYPAVENSARILSPELEPLPTLMAESLRYSNDTWGDGGADFAWNLPEESTTRLYNRVSNRLNAGRPMARPDEPAFHVRSVRARGFEAEVDILHPLDGGVYDFVTLDLDYELIDGWRVIDRRIWRIPKVAPLPSYTGPRIDDTDAAAVLASPEPMMAPVEAFPEAAPVTTGNMQPLP